MDWNSFFSSVGQSVAGIVGIFAAFIITKIINNQTEFDKKKAQNVELLAITEKFKARAEIRLFNWLNTKRLRSICESIKTDIRKIGAKSPEEIYYSYRFPKYLPREKALKRIQLILDVQTIGTNVDSVISRITAYPSDTYLEIEAANERNLQNEMREEEDKIENLVVEIKHHITLVKHHLDSLRNNPESSGLVTFSIIASLILFFLGVVYPFSFLPYNSNRQVDLSFYDLSFWAFFTILFSLKGFILFIPSVILSIILGVFLWNNSQLKYSSEAISELENACKIENYSRFFVIRLDNQNLEDEYIQSKKETTDANSNDRENPIN